MRQTVPHVVLGLLVLATVRPAGAQEPNFGRAITATATELFVGQPVNWYGPGTVYAFTADRSGRWRAASRGWWS